MINLRGTRVLLVDDDQEEAIPVIKACAKKGIPIAYFDGNIDDLPLDTEKLSGVRLAILDMDIVGSGDTDENKISTLIARLQAILSVNNGPYAIIAWTKHPELVDLLDRKLFRLFQSDDEGKAPLPVFYIPLEKKDFKTTTGGFDIDRLSSSIETEINKHFPLSAMQAWEERCARAASGVTNSISEMINPQADDPSIWRSDWNTNYQKIITSLAVEEVGNNNLRSDNFINVLFGALNPLHIDFIESDNTTLPNLPERFFPLNLSQPNPLAGKINTKLHLCLQDDNRFSPGNIYRLSDCADVISIDPKRIYEDIIQDAHKDDEELYAETTPILLEISASCDFAQNKIKYAKFLFGLKIPVDKEKKFKQPSYKKPFEALYPLGPLSIDDCDYLILLCAQYLITLDFKQVLQLKPFARLRNQWLTMIQFWIAQQISRPGIVMLK